MSKEYLGIEPIKDQKEIDMIFELYENSGVIHYQDMLKLKAYLTPPTAEEVCEALNTDVSLYPKIFYYDEISKTFKEIHISRNEEIVSYYTNGTITINPNYGIPPHLITLIGRFYEGLK